MSAERSCPALIEVHHIRFYIDFVTYEYSSVRYREVPPINGGLLTSLEIFIAVLIFIEVMLEDQPIYTLFCKNDFIRTSGLTQKSPKIMNKIKNNRSLRMNDTRKSSFAIYYSLCFKNNLRTNLRTYRLKSENY